MKQNLKHTILLAAFITAASAGYAQSLIDSVVSQSQPVSQLVTQANTYYNNKQYNKAVTLYKQAAEQGNAAAQNSLGFCYKRGYGVTQNLTQAFYWYQKAANQGNISGQCNLGTYYYDKKNYEQAVYWYQKSAGKGYANAQYSLGFCYEYGYGVTKDSANAINWYQKAAKQGNGYAKMALQHLQNNLNTNSQQQAPELGTQVPDLAMQTPNGKLMKISDFKGKYVLVDFWASWCPPCRAENPNVVQAYNKYKNKNFTILGVSLDMDKSAWLQAIKDDNLTWNHMSDLKYWNSKAVKIYKIDGIPFNVLIDPTGKIIAKSLRGDDLDNKLSQVLK